MKLKMALPAGAVLCISFASCATVPPVTEQSTGPVPYVVTADIQAGIERHIAEKSREDGGTFRLPFEDGELHLKLARVHTEFLANLGPRRHFACVDLASAEGDMYDVDFFLEGDPGDMSVTETTVHKVNGQPIYTWKQNRDHTWVRVPVEGAPPELLGVIKGSDEFDFAYLATVPELAESARMWIPMPVTDDYQTVEVKSLNAPGEWEILDEKEHGNKVLYLSLEPEDSHKEVAVRYHVRRQEKSVYAGDPSAAKGFLEAENLVPANETFQGIAQEVVEGKEGDLVRARALYDHTIDRMRYSKVDSLYGRGDAVYACDSRMGNCTDFHSYFIALARSVGIPARFAIGASIPSDRDEGAMFGYHCWAEFFTDGKWWPVDISEADKCSALSTYYFGRHPANRIELTRGRDLVVDPGPVSGPMNFLAYPVLEIGGKPAKAKVQFSFNRIAS